MLKLSPFIFFLVVLSLVRCTSEEPQYRDKIYQKPEIDIDPAAPSLSPEESMKKIYLPEGFLLELVASEPMIEEPIDIEWDADGKMYVAELLTYMQDIDGTDENMPWSRVSLLEDLDGDGVMDKRTVFVDSLLLPRVILPVDDRVIIGETYTRHFWSYRDTDGDGVADEKVQVFKDDSLFRGNMEHQSANLTWNIDNWMYLSKDPFRYKWRQGKMHRDTLLDAPTGQYGLTQDEAGRLFYSKAGGEVIALGFQQHPRHGRLEMDGRWEKGFEEPWPIIGTPDVQGGTKRLRPDNTLNKFTAVAGQAIFLGDRLPVYGDLFVPEPVGRLIRRAKVENIDGKIVLSNRYDSAEFLASTDPNFRPVMAKTGPDGCLYIVDMHRGIIQQGNWVRKGSYLRPEVERRKLDKNIGKGRIYRVVHEEMEPYQPIKLMSKSSEDLAEFLSHPNGWYRFNAQKLLVVRGDQSVVPILKDLLLERPSFISSLMGNEMSSGIGRLHALWTLDGLSALTKEILLTSLEDEDSRVRCAAIRLLEPYLEKRDDKVFESVSQMKNDPSYDVLIQIIQSVKAYATNHYDYQASRKLTEEILAANKDNEVIAIIAKEVPPEKTVLKEKFAAKNEYDRGAVLRGYDIYKELCASCHGDDGKGKKNLAPSLKDSPRVMGRNTQIPISIVLDGLVGPVDGVEYGVMAPMKSNSDQWVADVLTYVRGNFGDKGSIRGRHVANVRKKYKDREEYWTLEELEKDNK